MQATIWNPDNLKRPLVTGEAEVTEWVHAAKGAPRFRIVFTTQGVPDNDLAQYKDQILYIALEDGRQAKVKVQYTSTIPSGIITTLRVLSGWEEKLVG